MLSRTEAVFDILFAQKWLHLSSRAYNMRYTPHALMVGEEKFRALQKGLWDSRLTLIQLSSDLKEGPETFAKDFGTRNQINYRNSLRPCQSF